MIKKYIWCMGLLLIVLGSCSQEDLVNYDQSTRSLYIPTEMKDEIGGTIEGIDSTYFSFKQYADITDCEIRFTVILNGQQLEEDQTYRLEIIKEKTTALPEDYTVELEQTFHAGVWSDYLSIKLHRTAHLADEKVRLAVRLVPNENFGVGSYIGDPYWPTVRESISCSVTFCDMLSQPDWWDDTITSRFLGEYSDAKYARFIESSGITDITGYTSTELRLIVQQFSKDIQENGWTEDDGSLMEVVMN